jgi:hypothetical protein
LIVIAARGLIVKPSPKRAMPKTLKLQRKPAGRMAFRLYDTRKHFEFIPQINPLFVVVKTYTDNPFNLFNNPFPRRSKKDPDFINANQLSRRLAALSHALETIPQQARRMLRWQARRKLLQKHTFVSALRPGRAPGHRDKPTHEIDFILKECQWLAWDSLRRDSS